MAAKVERVLDSLTGQPVTVTDCENGYAGEYICDSKSCTANMSFVSSSLRHLEGDDGLERTVPIPAFFRLKPRQKHSEQCNHNLGNQVEIVAKKSDPDILNALGEGQYRLNLLIRPDVPEAPHFQRPNSFTPQGQI